MPDFTFKDNSVVADTNGVPEKYRGLYAEITEGDNAGKFGLIPAAAGVVGDLIGNQETLAGVRNDKKKVGDENAERRLVSKAIEEFVQGAGLEVGDDGILPALQAGWTGLQDQIKGGKDIKINMDKVNQQADERVRVVTETKDAEIKGMSDALSKHLISDAATRALAEHKGSIDLLLPHVRSACKVVKNQNGDYSVTVLDAQGDSRFNADGGPMGVPGLVAEMKTLPTFARAFESEAAGGAGVQPGSMARQTISQTGGPQRELSPIEKISVGLKKGQAVQGHGGGQM